MTIVAGFRFANGVLLCADSQHTYPGAMKINASKIFAHDFASQGGSKFVGAITGSVPYARMALDRCSRALSKSNKFPSAEMIEVVEEAIRSFHGSHIYPHPGAQSGGHPNFQLLIALWSHVDRELSLLATNDSAVTPVSEYDCLGAGSFLAHYLIPTIFHHRQMAVSDIANLAIHVLRETKEYVDTCGGSSEFVTLTDKGEISNVGHFDISTGETISGAYRDAISRLFIQAADLQVTEEKPKEEFDLAFQVLSATRKHRLNEMQEQAAFIESMMRVRRVANFSASGPPYDLKAGRKTAGGAPLLALFEKWACPPPTPRYLRCRWSNLSFKLHHLTADG